MAELGRRRRTEPTIKPRMTEFKQKTPSLVSQTEKGIKTTSKSIVSGAQRAAGRIATKEEAREIGKSIHKAATSKEVKGAVRAIGGFLDRWSQIGAPEEKTKKKTVKTPKICSCPCSSKKKTPKKTKRK